MTSGIVLDRAVMVAAVCERLATGKESLTAICEDLGFSRRTFNKWRFEDPEIDALAAAAREEWCQSLEEDLIEIADDSQNDYHVVQRAGKQLLEINAEAVARSKLRLYARERLLRAYNPKRWSDRLVTESTNHTTVEIVDTDEMDRRLDRAVAAACTAAGVVEPVITGS